MAVALTYLPVALRLGITVGDSSDDPDADPDTIWCDEGKVTLKPRIKDAVAKETGVSVLLGQAELTGMIRSDGWVVWDHALATVVTGVPCIKVTDLTSDAIQPYITSGATHDFTIVGAKARGTKVEFSRGNQPVRLSPAQIDPTIGVINLADQVVASPPTIVQVVTGPKGDKGDTGATGATGATGPAGGVNKVAGQQGDVEAQQLVDAIATPLSAQSAQSIAAAGDVRNAVDARVALGVAPANEAASAARSLARRGYNLRAASVSEMLLNAGKAGHGMTSTGGTAGSTYDLNDTSTYSLGTQSARITTDGAGGSARIQKAGLTSFDATGKAVRVWLRVDGVANAGNMYLYLGDDSVASASASNAFRAEIYSGKPARGSMFQDGEWTVYDIPWTSFAVLVGTPSRSAMTSFRLQVADKGAGSTTVRFGGIALIDEQTAFPNGVISLTFDDCFGAADTVARPKMDEYGYAGTLYPVVEAFGSSDNLTLARAKEMASQNGWDFGFHSMTWANHTAGFDTLTEEQLTAEFESMISWASANNVRGDSLAWPLTYSNALAKRVAANYFATSRGGQQSSMSEMLPPSDRMYLKPVGVGSTSTSAFLKAWVDRTKSGKCWTIFTFHDLKASNLGQNDTTPTIFNELIDYIAAQGVPVRTVGQVIGTL